MGFPSPAGHRAGIGPGGSTAGEQVRSSGLSLSNIKHCSIQVLFFLGADSNTLKFNC
jgi:hypothetical protein